jgi:hypothetical protein
MPITWTGSKAGNTRIDWGEDSPQDEFMLDLMDYGTIIFLAALAAFMVWAKTSFLTTSSLESL